MSNELWLALLDAKGLGGGVVIDSCFISLDELVQCVECLPAVTHKRVLIQASFNKQSLIAYLGCIKSAAQVLWIDRDVECDVTDAFPFDLIIDGQGSVVCQALHTKVDLKSFSAIATSFFKPEESINYSLPSIGFLTSGSTGKPKIVFQTLSSILKFSLESIRRFMIHDGTRCLLRSSTAWDIFVIELFSILLAGARSCLPPRFISNNPLALAKFVVENRINFMQLTPSFFDLLAYSTHGDGFNGVETFVLTGETLFCRHRVLLQFPRARFFTAYGSCELHNVLSADITDQFASELFICAGEPWDVVTGLTRAEQSSAFFHLAVESQTLMHGYCQDCLLVVHSGAYQNLDLFECRDGNYYCCGRLDEALGLDLSIWLHLFRCRANFLVDRVLLVKAISVYILQGVPLFIASSRAEADVIEQSMVNILRESPFQPESARVTVVKVVPRTMHGKVDNKRMIAQLMQS